jgi:hypothetical protein
MSFTNFRYAYEYDVAQGIRKTWDTYNTMDRKLKPWVAKHKKITGVGL